MSRKEFTVDALFGMPGVPAEAGSCKILNENTPQETFAHPWTEATYQVWLRGFNSKGVDIRNALMKFSEMTEQAAFPVDPKEAAFTLGYFQGVGMLPGPPVN